MWGGEGGGNRIASHRSLGSTHQLALFVQRIVEDLAARHGGGLPDVLVVVIQTVNNRLLDGFQNLVRSLLVLGVKVKGVEGVEGEDHELGLLVGRSDEVHDVGAHELGGGGEGGGQHGGDVSGTLKERLRRGPRARVGPARLVAVGRRRSAGSHQVLESVVAEDGVHFTKEARLNHSARLLDILADHVERHDEIVGEAALEERRDEEYELRYITS